MGHKSGAFDRVGARPGLAGRLRFSLQLLTADASLLSYKISFKSFNVNFLWVNAGFGGVGGGGDFSHWHQDHIPAVAKKDQLAQLRCPRCTFLVLFSMLANDTVGEISQNSSVLRKGGP